MGILDHYPAEKRWWKPERCVCGLRMRNCPDWRQLLNDLTARRLREFHKQLAGHFDAETTAEVRLAAVLKAAGREATS